jgi:hypothetical protein
LTAPWPVPIRSHDSIRCGSRLWSTNQAFRVTVIVKATFTLVPEGDARLAPPLDIVREDVRSGHGAETGLERASEIAPYLPSAGILLFGHAYPASATPSAASVRLGIGRIGPLLDKTLHVVGDRSSSAPSVSKPFDKMPLVYERAFGGPGFDENPAGVGASGAGPLPNILDPTNPRRAVGFGPIPRHWAPRRRFLGNASADKVATVVPALPEGFDFRYFHAAPSDQQLDFLAGDEWILLDGMHPMHPRLRSRLPGLRAEARFHTEPIGNPGQGREIVLSADTLVIDADRLAASVIFRGSFPVASLDVAPRLHLSAAISIRGAPQAPSPRPSKPAAGPTVVISTSELDTNEVMKQVLPFAAANLGVSAPPSVSDERASPRSDPPPRVRPLEEGAEETAVFQAERGLGATLPFGQRGPFAAEVQVPPSAAPVVHVEPTKQDQPFEHSRPPLVAARGQYERGPGLEEPSREPSVVRPVVAPAPGAPAPKPRPVARDAILLAGFDAASLPELRTDPRFSPILDALQDAPLDGDLDDPERVGPIAYLEERREIFEILACGRAADGEEIGAALARAVEPDGRYLPPLSLVSGELVFAFDELAVLKATVSAAVPRAGASPDAKRVIDLARSFLEMPGPFWAAGIALGLTTRIREAFETRDILPARYLEMHGQTTLSRERSFQRRAVFGELHVRGLLETGGAAIPTYLGPDLAALLPATDRLRARLLVRVHPSVDPAETHPVALRTVALGIITARPGSAERSVQHRAGAA